MTLLFHCKNYVYDACMFISVNATLKCISEWISFFIGITIRSRKKHKLHTCEQILLCQSFQNSRKFNMENIIVWIIQEFGCRGIIENSNKKS